jgi:UDP-N-acetylglucosamine 2-epimerase
VDDNAIVVTGNPVIDALQTIVAQPYDMHEGVLARVPADRKVILVTAHRRENFGEPLERIFTALERLAEKYMDNVHIVYPVHLNPHVYDPAHRRLGHIPNITLVEPLDYLPMVHMMDRATLLLTDSGGLQEEGPALGTPVLVMREVTERPEAIEAGTARLVGTDIERIVSETARLLDDSEAYSAMARAVNPFGDGHAAERIVAALLDYQA